MRSKIKLSVTALGQALFAVALRGQSVIAAEKTDGLTGEQIIERTREASKRTGQGDEVFKFYRKASFNELDAKGNVLEKNSKTYRRRAKRGVSEYIEQRILFLIWMGK